MSDFPIVVNQQGPQPTPPERLLEKLLTRVASEVPGYTANLPPALVTDLASTAMGAVALIDSAVVDLINSVTPYGENIPLLDQLGAIYGIPRGSKTNTSVTVVFSGTPGFVIPRGFTVSDGNHQYVVQKNSIIPASGQSSGVYCLATAEGSWAVPVGTVKQIITSLPASIALSVTNTVAGVPGLETQDHAEYRAQVMAAGMFAVQGTPDMLKAALGKVPGVHKNLIAYRQVALGKWAVVVGGGDPYEVARAIYEAVPDPSVLTDDVNNFGGVAPQSQRITISDFPDSYEIVFLVPTSQTVKVILTWNTAGRNFIDPASIASLAVPAIERYINAIYVGEPVNIYQLQSVFQQSISSILSTGQLSLIKVSVAIDGKVVEPDKNTGLIQGDYYKYLVTNQASISVQKYDGKN